MNTIIRTVILVFFLSAQVNAEQISSFIEDGGSVVVKGSYDIIFANKESSLRRTWVIVNDSNCPIDLGKTGVHAGYSDYFRFTPSGSVSMRSDVVAFEIRFILYDIFGDHIKTLSTTEVTNIVAGDSFDLTSSGGAWRAWGNEASEFLSSVAYVAQVRTADSQIWRYDAEGIAKELAKIEIKIDSGLLEPTKEK